MIVSLQGSLTLAQPACPPFHISFHRLNMNNKAIEVAECRNIYIFILEVRSRAFPLASGGV